MPLELLHCVKYSTPIVMTNVTNEHIPILFVVCEGEFGKRK